MNNLLCAQALTYIGVREFPGKRANPVIVEMLRSVLPKSRSDEIAWCAAFVKHVTSECGYQSKHANAAARSWLKEGTAVDVLDACPGDIGVLWRGNRNGWSGHVGFVCRLTTKYIWLLGGNQNNKVSVRAYRIERLLGVRRLCCEEQ